MSLGNENNGLIIEEVKATKLFLLLFFIFFIAYDLFYYYIIPLNKEGMEIGLPASGLGYWLYLFVFGLLPIALYYLKNKPNLVKYIVFLGYNLIDFINSLMIYMKSSSEFASGNIVELYFILFTPIFINKRYFWLVAWSIILKYGIYAILLHDPNLILGIVIIIILGGVSYLFLSRFHSYLNTLEKINEEIRHKDKLVVVGQLATSIGHEIRNPLAALKGLTQLQIEKYPNENEYYQIMQDEIERVNLIVNDLMYIGKPNSLNIEKHDLKKVIEYVVKMQRHIAKDNQITVEVNIKDTIDIYCDVNRIKQVFINLVKNAIEAMPFGGTIKISSDVISEKKQVVIFIEDEGQGIEEDKIKMLGSPFFTTKYDGNGLGLMVTFNIIEQHNGQIFFNSTFGKGTTVEVHLPNLLI
jgi:signal transduction histidine kinase